MPMINLVRANLQLQFDAGLLRFTADGVALHNARPAVTLLAGPAETPVTLYPLRAPTYATFPRTTPAGTMTEHRWRWADVRGYAFSWSVSVFDDRPGFTLRGSFHNGSDEAVRLHEFALCRSENGAVTCAGDPSAWWLSTLNHTMRLGHMGELLPSTNESETSVWEGFGLPVPHALPHDERSTDGRWRSYPDFLTLYTDGGARGIVAGAVGSPEADIRFDCRVDNGAMRLDIVSEMSDVLVAPGETRDAQEVLILSGPYEPSLELLVRWIAATHGARNHCKPVVGWCSWYDLGQRISAESVSATVAAFAEHARVDVIQIDDGFSRTVGDWECNERFPDGLAPIVEAIRAQGAEAGIWLAPVAMHDSLPYLHEHPDWFQRDAAGELVGQADNWGPTSRWLDPTHPGVQQFVRAIIRQKRAEGFTYFKFDFNTVGAGVRFHDPRKTRLQAARDLYRLYREELGEESYLLACSGFMREVFGFADAARVAPDSGATWSALHPCTILECIRGVGMNALANGIAFANDPDVTYTKPRSKLTEAEWQTWHSIVGLLGGLMLISEPMQQPEYAGTFRMLDILSPPAPEKGRSFHAATDRNHQQFGFVAERPWGNNAAVLLWNTADTPATVALDARGLERLGERFHVWSFWDERYYGISAASFTTDSLPAHGPALLRLTALPPDERLPVVVGSTLHIALGAAEIANVAATPRALTIQLTNAGARDGALYVFCRDALLLESAIGCTIPAVAEGPKAVWRIALTERQRDQAQKIRLRVMG